MFLKDFFDKSFKSFFDTPSEVLPCFNKAVLKLTASGKMYFFKNGNDFLAIDDRKLNTPAPFLTLFLNKF